MTVALHEGAAVGPAPAPIRSVDQTAFALSAELSLLARHRLAADDLTAALKLYRLCWTLAWLDIKGRYRGSVLGPLWLTLSTAVMVVALGLLYSTLFRTNLHDDR